MTPITQTESSVDPGQVEAFAARGYSLVDIARLLGVDRNTFFNQRSEDQEISEAHNRGFQRWKDAGEPPHVSVKELIQSQVYALLQQREMSRPQLRDELGFRHEEINLAIESLEEGLMIQREDDVRTSWYRANGVASPVADKRRVSVVVVEPSNVAPPTVSDSNGHSDLTNASPDPCVDCGGPKSYGAGQRCQKCFDAKVAARQAEKAIDTPVRLSARSPDPPRKWEVFDVNNEQKTAPVEAHTLTAPSPPRQSIPANDVLCGCGRLRSHLGRCAYRRDQAVGDSTGKPDLRRGPTYKELDLAEVERVMATEETIEAGARKLGMTSAQLYVRRQKEEAVDHAVGRGRKTYYANAPEVDLSDNEPAISQTGSKFGISVNGEIRKIVEGLPVGVETDTPHLLAALLIAHPELENHPDTSTLRTYIAQAVAPLKGKLLEIAHKGSGVTADTLRRIAESEAAPKIVARKTRATAVTAPRFGDFCLQNCDPSTVGHHMNCDYFKPNQSIRIPEGESGIPALNVDPWIDLLERELGICTEERDAIEKRITALEIAIEGLRQVKENPR